MSSESLSINVSVTNNFAILEIIYSLYSQHTYAALVSNDLSKHQELKRFCNKPKYNAQSSAWKLLCEALRLE